MTKHYATVPVPNAEQLAARKASAPLYEQVRALLTLVRRGAVSNQGVQPSVADVARMLGVSVRTLEGYMTKPRQKRGRRERNAPYLVVYALEIMAACPRGTAVAIWGEENA